MKTVHELNAAIKAKSAEVVEKAAAAESNPTAEALAEVKSLNDAIESLTVQRDNLIAVQEMSTAAKARITEIEAQTNDVPLSGSPEPAVKTETKQAGVITFSRVADQHLTAWTGTRAERELKAVGFGHWMRAALTHDEGSLKFCKSNGYEVKAAAGNSNSTGGALVPVQFDSDIISLITKYGVFPQYSKTRYMTGDTLIVPRRTGGLTAYFTKENDALTASGKSWDNVQLTARKLSCLAKYSSEIAEDAIIAMGNDFAMEIAQAFAQKIDGCGFIGDGSSTYDGISGATTKLKAVDGTIANIKGLQVASGNLYSEVTLADLNGVKARLPEFARMRGNVAWFCSRAFFAGVMEKLMMATGGITPAMVATGAENFPFMGFPVVITEAMPTTEANSQVCVLLGDLALASSYGDRRGLTIALSEHANFENDQWTIRGTTRFDINVHDVGNTTAAGPLVGLITAAS